MRIELRFGNTDIRHVTWYNSIGAFPTLVNYAGKKWEFVMYEDGKVDGIDKILHFSRLNSYDPNFHATTYQDIEYLLDKVYGPNCECGKDKHNFTSHSDWCPKGKK